MVVAQVIALLTTDREVPGSNPARSWELGFSLSLSLVSFLSFNQRRVLNQVPQMKSLAVQLEAKQASYALNEKKYKNKNKNKHGFCLMSENATSWKTILVIFGCLMANEQENEDNAEIWIRK